MAEEPGTTAPGAWSLTVAASYPEGSARRIADRAAELGHLARYLTVGRPQWRLDPRVLALLVGSTRAQRISTRFPRPTTFTASRTEVPRLAAKLSRDPLAVRDTMYRTAEAFDLSVARTLAEVAPSAHIGLPGSSLASFTAVKGQGGTTAFHAVNAHPAVQNEILLAHHSSSAVARELVPQHVQDRVSAELELADVVVVPSRFVHDQMTAHGVPPERLAVLPFGVDLRAFRPSASERTPGPVRVLLVGQISRRKGVDVLAEAARRTSVEVTLLGPVVSRELLDGLPANVRHVGQLSPAEVVTAMQHHDAFVLPSLEDACALVTVEAAATGLPVITTRANGGYELLGDDPALHLVEPGDPRSLADTLAAVEPLALPHREALAAARRQRALASWPQYADDFLRLLEGARDDDPRA